MATLQITITTEALTDFDGNSFSVKQLTSTIDNISTKEVMTVDTSVTDEAAKTSYRNFLTSKEYIWDNEI